MAALSNLRPDEGRTRAAGTRSSIPAPQTCDQRGWLAQPLVPSGCSVRGRGGRNGVDLLRPLSQSAGQTGRAASFSHMGAGKECCSCWQRRHRSLRIVSKPFLTSLRAQDGAASPRSAALSGPGLESHRRCPSPLRPARAALTVVAPRPGRGTPSRCRRAGPGLSPTRSAAVEARRARRALPRPGRSRRLAAPNLARPQRPGICGVAAL